MPRAPRVLRKGKTLARDPTTNNVIGGVRPPWITVPVAAYMTDPETGCGEAYDTKLPYTAAKLRALYGSHANYVRRFEAARNTLLAQGYLLPEDIQRVKPIAGAADFVSDAARGR